MKDLIKTYDQLHQAYVALGGIQLDQKHMDDHASLYVYNTCAIEQNTFTVDETKTFLETGQIQKNRSTYEHNQLEGSINAFKLINQLPAQAITESIVLDIHYEVLTLENPEYAGRYKIIRNRVGNHMTPSPEKVKILFPEALEKFNQSLEQVHPMIAGATLHYDTAYIHPFQDGNGRTARLLHNYALISRGYSQIMFLVANRTSYIDAIKESIEQDDATPLVSYSFQEAIAALQDKVAHLKKEGGGTPPQ